MLDLNLLRVSSLSNLSKWNEEPSVFVTHPEIIRKRLGGRNILLTLKILTANIWMYVINLLYKKSNLPNKAFFKYPFQSIERTLLQKVGFKLLEIKLMKGTIIKQPCSIIFKWQLPICEATHGDADDRQDEGPLEDVEGDVADLGSVVLKNNQKET